MGEALDIDLTFSSQLGERDANVDTELRDVDLTKNRTEIDEHDHRSQTRDGEFGKHLGVVEENRRGWGKTKIL